MRATYNIKTDKKIKLEKAAVELSYKLGKPVKWTEIMEVLVDKFYKDAIAHIEYENQKKPEKK